MTFDIQIPPAPAPAPEPPADPGPWYYAQVDADGICTGVTQTSGPLDGAAFVRLDELDASLIGQVWADDEWAPGAPPPPPAVVTMRQARLALLQLGLLDDVETAINALSSPQKEAARIEWEYSGEVHRTRPFVQLLAPALGLDSDDLDQLFTAAAEL